MGKEIAFVYYAQREIEALAAEAKKVAEALSAAEAEQLPLQEQPAPAHKSWDHVPQASMIPSHVLFNGGMIADLFKDSGTPFYDMI